LKTALDEKWKGAYNFTDAMNHLKNEYSHVFNGGDPYLGTLGVYSKKYYMKDVT